MPRTSPRLHHRSVAAAALLVAGLAASLVVPTPVSASEWGDVSYFGDDDVRVPQDLAVGSDGNLWFTNASGGSIGRLTPTGDLASFPVGDPNLLAPQNITAGPGGSLYFTALFDGIGRITTAGTVTAFTHPDLDTPNGITTGPDGNVWFTSMDNGLVGRLTPQGFTMFDDPGVLFPEGITTGPDGNLWFTQAGGLGRITTAGEITVFSHPTLVDYPNAITTGPDGALWFVDDFGDRIGRFTVDGELTTFEDAQVDAPTDIVVGPDGNLWFTSEGNDRIGYITTAGTIRTFDATDDDGDGEAPRGITIGPDDNVWFTAAGSEHVARVQVCEGGVFSDVALSHPFRADVCWMGVEEISTGYDDGTYQPSAAVTRQAMSAFMFRLAGTPAFALPGSPSFSDVGSGHPFFEEVEWMADAEISAGYGDGTFRPADPVTRQAMSAFMFRLAGAPAFALPGSPSFSDVGTGHPFFEEVEFMAEAEISTGYEDGTYRPSSAVTRQAMSAFMRRLAEGPYAPAVSAT